MQRIADGIELEDGPIHADAISYATETDRNQAGIEIHSGRNRIVRRIFESLGYHVTKLDRVYFAGLTKKNLPAVAGVISPRTRSTTSRWVRLNKTHTLIQSL